MIMAEPKKSERGSVLLKFFDRYVGIPLVFILGLFTLFRNKSAPAQVKKIAILKTAAIGDTVLVTAIINDLKLFYPDVEIDFYSGASNFAFAKLIGQCRKVIQLPIKNFPKLFEILKSEKYDLLLDFGAWPRINSVCSFFIDADYKVGFKTQDQYRHFVYDKSVDHSNEIHELENYRNIIRSIGIKTTSAPVIPEGEVPKNLMHNLQQPYIVCHLWPGGERSDLKEWTFENWKKIISFVQSKNYFVLLTGGKEDLDKNSNFLNATGVKAYNMAGTTVSETIGALKNAKVVISVNTGIMHIAAGLNVPTVGLHGPTSVKRWGPVGRNVCSVISQLEGCQYLNLGFEYKPELQCMESISADDVIDAVKAIV